MAEDNDINVPPLKNKEGGLIKLFLDKIPFGYGQQAYKSLVRANDDKENFKNINDFIEEHYRKYEENKSVAEHFVKDNKVSSSYNEKSNNTSRFSSSRRNSQNKFNNNFNSKYGKAASLQHIHYHDGDQDSPTENIFRQEESESQDDNFSDENSSNNEATDDNPRINNNNDADSDFSDNNDAKADDADRNVMQEKLSELMLLDNNRNKGSSSNSVGCRSMVFYNDCKSAPNCNFSHEVKALQKSHAYYSDLLNKSKFKPSTGGSGSSSLNNNTNQHNRHPPAASNKEPKLLLKRPKPPPPRDSRNFHHLAEADDQNSDKL